MKVTFWGVRGTFPATGERFLRYGGDTMCIEVDCGGQSIILDAGTGLRMLGEKLQKRPGAIDVHLILSHAHVDHLLGFLQFAPLWRRDASLTVWSTANGEDDPAEAARALLAPPFTPAGAANFVARLAWSQLTLDKPFEPFPGVEVLPFAVTHPGGACGYRIDHADVNHRPRSHGTSKYGTLDRLLVSISDLQGVRWLARRSRRPERIEEL
jgi:phosphoribosyl 1,2-cyclic phosphodiesterase